LYNEILLSMNLLNTNGLIFFILSFYSELGSIDDKYLDMYPRYLSICNYFLNIIQFNVSIKDIYNCFLLFSLDIEICPFIDQ